MRDFVDTAACPCGNDDPTYRHSDRHRGYYACDACGRGRLRVVVHDEVAAARITRVVAAVSVAVPVRRIVVAARTRGGVDEVAHYIHPMRVTSAT